MPVVPLPYSVKELERAFLSEGEAGKRCPCRGLGDLDLHRGDIGGSDIGRAQKRELGENFAVELGYEIVLTAGVLAPDLSELDGFHGHEVFPLWFQGNGRGGWRQRNEET